MQFELEQEVRLLWIITNATAPDVFQLSFEWNEIVEQVRIGPTIDEKSARDAYDALVRVGVPEDLVKYSAIYRAPGELLRQRPRQLEDDD